jgi:hypothetical protein
MTTRDLTSTLSAVANRLQVIAGLTTELRRSALAEAQTLVHLEGEVDRDLGTWTVLDRCGATTCARSRSTTSIR